MPSWHSSSSIFSYFSMPSFCILMETTICNRSILALIRLKRILYEFSRARSDWSITKTKSRLSYSLVSFSKKKIRSWTNSSRCFENLSSAKLSTVGVFWNSSRNSLSAFPSSSICSLLNHFSAMVLTNDLPNCLPFWEKIFLNVLRARFVPS